MRQTECVPEHNVFVVERNVRVGGNPGGNSLGRCSGGLRDVAACGVDLVVVVCDGFLVRWARVKWEGGREGEDERGGGVKGNVMECILFAYIW